MKELRNRLQLENFSKTLNESADQAFSVLGNPEADWDRNTIKAQEDAFQFDHLNQFLKYNKVPPVSSVLLEADIVKLEDNEIRYQEEKFKLELSKIQVSVPNEQLTYLCQEDSIEIPGSLLQYEHSLGPFEVLAERETHAKHLLEHSFFSSQTHTKENNQQDASDKISWTEYLQELFPDDSHAEIRQYLETKAGQSIFNHFLFHLLTATDKHSNPIKHPLQLFHQMVIIAKNDPEKPAKIQCMMFCLSEVEKQDPNELGYFRIRDHNNTIITMDMSSESEYLEYKEKREQIIKELSNPKKSTKILRRMRQSHGIADIEEKTEKTPLSLHEDDPITQRSFCVVS